MESVPSDCSLKTDLAAHFCYFPNPKFSLLTYLSDFSTDLENRMVLMLNVVNWKVQKPLTDD